LSVQVGASLDFAAGRIPRAPRWVQRGGVEWLFRLYQEPRRLLGRYLRNASFLAGRACADAASLLRRGTCGEGRLRPENEL
jgi:UDP-N-acetyl-D-mannosaminuronic acid transferase (WecB/TagA/CpsF family)